MDDISFNGTKRFVSDDHKNLLFFLQTDEIPKPGPFSQPAGTQTQADRQTHGKAVKLVQIMQQTEEL